MVIFILSSFYSLVSLIETHGTDCQERAGLELYLSITNNNITLNK